MTNEERQNHNELVKEKQTLQDENLLLKVHVEWLEQQLKLAKAREFGPSSEKSTPTQEVLVFNEAEQLAEPEILEPTIEVPAHKRKPKKTHEELFKNIPVEEVHYPLEGDDLICETCNSPIHIVGTEVQREIEIIPPQFKLVKRIREKGCCPNCQKEGNDVPFIVAPAPKPAFTGSFASPSAVAFVLFQKFVLGTPLYRQEQFLKNQGLPLSRQTLANWMLWGAEILGRIYSRMKTHLLALDILHADETAMQVLKEPGRKAQTKSSMWLYLSGRAGPPIVIYEYKPTRAAEHPKTFLQNFTGCLHTDGYVCYENLPGVKLSGCWSHTRRKFFDIIKILPRSARDKGGTLAHEGLAFCDKIFEIERKLHDCSDEERKAGRLKLSKPKLDEFRLWLDVQSVSALPQSALGKAVVYCLNQWSKLIVFLEDGRLEVDNNRAERAVKPFVIGRKNWLFANTPCGAQSSATSYSVVESAKQNGLNPLAYLTHIFSILHTISSQDTAALDALMPWSEEMQTRFNIDKQSPA